MRWLPFSFRRPLLILKGLATDRDRPDFARLEQIEEPERFLWEILPHAARTFAPCIALLPESAARPAAVAYLYCRMLDTYEDLLPDPDEREAALGRFVRRLEEGAREPPEPLGAAADQDGRDRAHLLLVRRGELVDRVYLTLAPEVRELVRDLVRDMAAGMIRYSRAFAAQGGVLVSEAQVADYCRAVIGNPVVFVLRLLALRLHGRSDLSPELRENAMRVGELVQLANVTRDIEKDLGRGVAYRPELRADLDRPSANGRADRVARARRELLRMALLRAPSYRRMIEGMRLPRVSLARVSALLMLLYTHRYYGRCAAASGVRGWSRGPGGLGLLATVAPTTWSPSYADRTISRVERDFLRTARRIQ